MTQVVRAHLKKTSEKADHNSIPSREEPQKATLQDWIQRVNAHLNLPSKEDRKKNQASQPLSPHDDVKAFEKEYYQHQRHVRVGAASVTERERIDAKIVALSKNSHAMNYLRLINAPLAQTLEARLKGFMPTYV